MPNSGFLVIITVVSLFILTLPFVMSKLYSKLSNTFKNFFLFADNYRRDRSRSRSIEDRRGRRRYDERNEIRLIIRSKVRTF